jgi:hypothetical protein
MKRFPSKQKAIDTAIWQNLNYRYDDNYGVIRSKENKDYIVLQKDHPMVSTSEFIQFTADYAGMTYDQIQAIASDRDPLAHWEEIRGMFSTVHGETLRFLLFTKVPLDKFIRHTLASRGYDPEFNWVGFDKAEAIWLK